MFWNRDHWRELERLRSEFDALFQGERSSPAARTFPLFNAYDSSDALTITAELAGMDKDDVSITYANGVLTLKGNRKPCVADEKSVFVRRERACGEFEKSFTLPVKIDPEKITARFENGILVLVLPKAEEAKPKRITINAA